MHDLPIPYIERIRSYYQALGYGPPYEWAHNAEVPFSPMRRPLAQSRIAIVTTAAPYQRHKGDQGPGAPYNAAAKFYTVYSMDSGADPDLRISHVAIDRKHTTAEDIGAYFPLRAMRELAQKGTIGGIAPHFHGAPTNRSRNTTISVDCAEIVRRCQSDDVDGVVLVPNCPVCHQTVSLAARALESEGIATVVMGAAKDIVELAGVPRFLFSDFPLGNSAGRPRDPASQRFTLDLALRLLERAPAARTTVQSPLIWSSDPTWKQDYMNASLLSDKEIAERRADFDRQKKIARDLRGSAGLAPA